MITLLLAFFIVLFAMSSVNATKFQSLQQSLEEALAAASWAASRSRRPAARRGRGREARVTDDDPAHDLVVAAGRGGRADRLRELKAKIDRPSPRTA